MTELKSRLFTGWIRHRRFQPSKNEFCYKVFFPYLCLDEMDDVFSQSRLWQQESRGLAVFKRSDFHGPPHKPLKDAVLDTVETNTGERPTGAVFMLANLRYFGYIINPICVYYCFDHTQQLHSIVAEVTNTPWKEKCHYVLNCNEGDRKHQFNFDKAMHVSPFNPMAMVYQWSSNTPGEHIAVHLENWNREAKVMDATLLLDESVPITSKNLNYAIAKYPFMTFKTVAAIYWQATKLWIKKSPVYAHSKMPSKPQNSQP